MISVNSNKTQNMTVMNNHLLERFRMEINTNLLVFNQGILAITGILGVMKTNQVSVENVMHVMAQDTMHKSATS